jgi:multimeric flavodoxin WrbA
MSREVIILGSANSNGDTRQFIEHILLKREIDVIDLKPLNISHFDYDYKNEDDDFLPLITRVIENYDTIILASPVYWYSISGLMKVFLDRISDLLYHHKDLGRKLRGKSMALVSSTNFSDVGEIYAFPIKSTAEYLGMTYLGHCHGLIKEGKIESEIELRIEKLIESLNAVSEI